MKRVVVDMKKGRTVELGDDGTFSTGSGRGRQVGDVIREGSGSFGSRRFLRQAVAIAAVLMLFTVGAFAYTTPTAYVGLDADGSVGYSINPFDRVIAIEASDPADEASVALAAALKEAGVKNMNIEKAIRIATEQMLASGFPDTTGGGIGILVSIGSDNAEKAEKLALQIQKHIEQRLAQEERQAEVAAEAVGLARVREARALDVTPGKLNLVQKLIEADSQLDEGDRDEWLGKSVREIGRKMNENQEDGHEGSDGENNAETEGEGGDDAGGNGNGGGMGGGNGGGR